MRLMHCWVMIRLCPSSDISIRGCQLWMTSTDGTHFHPWMRFLHPWMEFSFVKFFWENCIHHLKISIFGNMMQIIFQKHLTDKNFIHAWRNLIHGCHPWIEKCHPWIEKFHLWIKVSSVVFIHELLFHLWMSFIDDIHGWRWQMMDIDGALSKERSEILKAW